MSRCLGFPLILASTARSRLSHDSYLIGFVAKYAECMLVASRFLVTMFYFAYTVTIFLLTSVIGLVRLLIKLSHLCLIQLMTTRVVSPMCHMSSSLYEKEDTLIYTLICTSNWRHK